MKTKLDAKILKDCEIDFLWQLYLDGGFYDYNGEIHSYEDAKEILNEALMDGFNQENDRELDFEENLDLYTELLESHYDYVLIDNGIVEVTKEKFISILVRDYENGDYSKEEFKDFYRENIEEFEKLGFRSKTIKETIVENINEVKTITEPQKKEKKWDELSEIEKQARLEEVKGFGDLIVKKFMENFEDEK